MRKMLIYLVLMAAFTDIKSQDALKEMSLKISECQAKEGIRCEGEDYYNNVRIKLIETGMLRLFDKVDTLFFLETYDIESGKYYGEIWGVNDKRLTFIFNQIDFTFNEPSIFTAYTRKLIDKWDVQSIRLEEKSNSTLTNPFLILGSRVINLNGTFKVDCIKFKEFFLLERDR